MKWNSKKRNLVSPTGGILGVLLVAALITFSYGFNQKTEDLWQQLGIQQQDANSNIKNSFLTGFLRHYGARNIKNIASDDKAAVARSLLNYTREYINTQFKPAYDKERQSSRPRERVQKPLRTKEQIQKEEVAKLEQTLKKTEENMKTMNEETRKIIAPGLEQNKKMLEGWKKPGNQFFEMMAQGEKDDQEREKADYKKALEEWEIKFPEDYQQVIKERLRKMLQLTENVDFNAVLKDVNGKKKFVNPVYESKKPEWKMAFRAGKEVTDLTRKFAQEWLAEIK